MQISGLNGCVAVGSVLLLLAGCGSAYGGDSSVATGAVREKVQAAFVDISNENGTAFPVNLLYSGASTIFAAVIAPQLQPGVAGSPGWTGGCTFISKHYAITAAHVVDGSPSGRSTAFQYEGSTGAGFTVQQISTSGIQSSGNGWAVLAAEAVSGTSHPNAPPQWTVGFPMTAAEGYVVTPMTCFVTFRCHSNFGPRNCPFIVGDTDIALIHCPTRSAGTYMTVNNGNPTSGNVVINWFHEVLSLATNSADTTHAFPSGNWANYGFYNSDPASAPQSGANNFHYAASSTNQLLPLQFVNWPGGEKYRIVSAGSIETFTDVPGCHGTSGSGTFLNGTSTLLGPQLHGGMGSQLCFDMLNTPHGGGTMSYLNAPFAKVIEGWGTISPGDR